MILNFLLDTNVAVRRAIDPAKISREQNRILDQLERQGQSFAISAISLLEIAFMFSEGRQRVRGKPEDVFTTLNESPGCEILPITVEIASEAAALLRTLRDPGDCTIVATARVHRLKLMTSDQRIIESGLVTVVE